MLWVHVCFALDLRDCFQLWEKVVGPEWPGTSTGKELGCIKATDAALQHALQQYSRIDRRYLYLQEAVLRGEAGQWQRRSLLVCFLNTTKLNYLSTPSFYIK